jgi:hypothetical protein
MTETLYPIYYGTRLVNFDTLKATFEPHMHPEFSRRVFNFILHHGGKFGIGGGYRPPGTQPLNKPGFAPPGKSFHEGQMFPSGLFYAALDMIVVNPGYKHRSPFWSEVPKPKTQGAFEYGLHFNVDTEPWHMQPIELGAWTPWVAAGRPDLRKNYPFTVSSPRPQPAQPNVPSTQPNTKETIVQFKSRDLGLGSVGNDVKFFQKQLNTVAGQSLILDGYYGEKTENAIKNWQTFTKLTVDGKLGAVTQQSIIEFCLAVG